MLHYSKAFGHQTFAIFEKELFLLCQPFTAKKKSLRQFFFGDNLGPLIWYRFKAGRLSGEKWEEVMGKILVRFIQFSLIITYNYYFICIWRSSKNVSAISY